MAEGGQQVYLAAGQRTPFVNVDGPFASAAIACTTGTERLSESRAANGPSTPTNGVRTPASSQMVCP